MRAAPRTGAEDTHRPKSSLQLRRYSVTLFASCMCRGHECSLCGARPRNLNSHRHIPKQNNLDFLKQLKQKTHTNTRSPKLGSSYLDFCPLRILFALAIPGGMDLGKCDTVLSYLWFRTF